MSVFSGIGAKIKADGEKVKAALLKAMNEVDGVILPEAEVLQPLIDTVANAAVPGSSGIVDIAMKWFEDSAGVLDAGGAAAEANLANAGYDVAAIAAIKGYIPALKAAKTLATPPVQVAAPAAQTPVEQR
jgi:hypothetical protein